MAARKKKRTNQAVHVHYYTYFKVHSNSPYLDTPFYRICFLKGKFKISVAVYSNSWLPPSCDVLLQYPSYSVQYCVLSSRQFRYPDTLRSQSGWIRGVWVCSIVKPAYFGTISPFFLHLFSYNVLCESILIPTWIGEAGQFQCNHVWARILRGSSSFFFGVNDINRMVAAFPNGQALCKHKQDRMTHKQAKLSTNITMALPFMPSAATLQSKQAFERTREAIWRENTSVSPCMQTKFAQPSNNDEHMLSCSAICNQPAT